MPEQMMIEQYHVTLTISDRVPDEQASVIRRVLTNRKFRAAFRRTVKSVLWTYPELRRVQVTVTV